jgi:hypothetical protein
VAIDEHLRGGSGILPRIPPFMLELQLKSSVLSPDSTLSAAGKKLLSN